MSAFEFVSVALSIVVGLGLTQILRSAVVAFRARHEYALEVLPLVWATVVFVTIIQFWWAIFELDASGLVTEWSLSAFLLLLGLTVLLFLAAALVLPGTPTDLVSYFDADGRWALAMLGGYLVCGVAANVVLFGSDLADPVQVVMYVMVVLLGGVVFSRRGAVRLVLSAAYAVCLAWGLVSAAPPTYPS